MFACPHCDLVSDSSREHFKHLRRCQPQIRTETTKFQQPFFGGTTQIPLPQQDYFHDSTDIESSHPFSEFPQQEQSGDIIASSHSHLNPLIDDDEHTDDGGDFVEESVFHTIPDPDNEPNDSCMSTFFSQVGVIGFILGNDFLAYLRSKADKTNSNLTEQLNSDSALPKPFDWKSKNFEVLSQLFNTLALSESQAEMILLGVSLILILNLFGTLLNNAFCRYHNLTRHCPCQAPFLKFEKRSPESFKMLG